MTSKDKAVPRRSRRRRSEMNKRQREIIAGAMLTIFIVSSMYGIYVYENDNIYQTEANILVMNDHATHYSLQITGKSLVDGYRPILQKIEDLIQIPADRVIRTRALLSRLEAHNTDHLDVKLSLYVNYLKLETVECEIEMGELLFWEHDYFDPSNRW